MPTKQDQIQKTANGIEYVIVEDIGDFTMIDVPENNQVVLWDRERAKVT